MSTENNVLHSRPPRRIQTLHVQEKKVVFNPSLQSCSSFVDLVAFWPLQDINMVVLKLRLHVSIVVENKYFLARHASITAAGFLQDLSALSRPVSAC